MERAAASEREFRKILGVAADATEAEIEQRFHQLAKQTHPNARRSHNNSLNANYDKIKASYDGLIMTLKSGAEGARKIQAAQDHVCQIDVKLCDVYSGTDLTIAINRSTAVGKERIYVPICIQKGVSNGHKIRVKRAGDYHGSNVVADVVFVLCVCPEERFTRKGDDLYTTVEMTLADALTKGAFSIRHVDGRLLHVRKPDANVPITPRTRYRIASHGMPVYQTPGQRGDLFVEFDIKFPQAVRSESMEQLATMLSMDTAAPTTDNTPHLLPAKHADWARARSRS